MPEPDRRSVPVPVRGAGNDGSVRGLRVEGQAGLGGEPAEELWGVLDDLEAVLDDGGELDDVAGSEVAQAVLADTRRHHRDPKGDHRPRPRPVGLMLMDKQASAT